MLCQYYSFSEGWNSISSYLSPSDPDVVTMFSPLGNKLIAMNNLTSIYWPGVNVNTIGNFDNASGYAIKVTEDAGFTVGGSEFANTGLTLDQGWQYLPVLSECDVNIWDLFGENIENIIIIQDLIGIDVFWPEMGIYDLETLEPGKAYRIKTANGFTVFFPGCGGAPLSQISSQVNSIPTLWGDVAMTPSTQVTAVLHAALSEFIEGDVIGAFGQSDQLYGYLEVDSQAQTQAITLFGDDATSADQNGFADGEVISYKLFRTSTGEAFDLEVEYDYSVGNSSGNYQSGSLAAITNIEMNSSGTGTLNTASLEIYPNPASEEITIKLNNGYSSVVGVKIIDSKGQVLIEKNFTNKTNLNVSAFSGGVYYVKINNENLNEVRKIVIR